LDRYLITLLTGTIIFLCLLKTIELSVDRKKYFLYSLHYHGENVMIEEILNFLEFFLMNTFSVSMPRWTVKIFEPNDEQHLK